MKKFLSIFLTFLVVVLGAQLAPIAPSHASTPKFPQRIISLSPSATEDLFAIGAGPQVIAVDDYSNFPKNTPKTNLSGYTPNFEAIVKFRPDLVIIQSSAAKSEAIVTQLKKLKIPVYVEHTPETISQAYSEIKDLGTLTGKTTGAKNVIDKMKKQIAAVLLSGKVQGQNKVFHELDNTLYSATSKTFVGKVYADFGLINIADAASAADDGGYPQLQNEYVIKANPDYIFLTDGVSIESVKGRPGWAGISAALNMKIVSLPEDISSRWGPRIVDLYKAVAQALKK
ncbi:FepB ABC-type Fe3+-hydroxamate transport system, periplasmic component [Candidatus Nanopelagicaceae bacterium]